MKHSRFAARLFLFLGLLAGLLAATVEPALAHALLVRSNPAANASLSKAPPQVEIIYSEPLEPRLSSINVLDASGKRVDQGDTRVDPANPERLTVSLLSLVDGVYTVSWKVVSQADGHVTTGTFPFGVGSVNASELQAAPAASSRIPLSPGSVAGKWLFILCLAVLAGREPFRAWIWQPAFGALGEAAAPASRKIQTIALAAAFAALGLELLLQAGQVSGRELAWPWSGETGAVLLNTRWGLLWLLRFDLLLAFTWLRAGQTSKWKSWAGFGVCLGLLLAISLSSHAAADPQPLAPIAIDWLHLVAMTLWIGGLAYFVSAMWSLKRTGDAALTSPVSLAIARFSILALGCVSLLAATGLLAALERVDAWQSLTSAAYGRVLLAKLGLTALLVGIGAYNLLFLSPSLKRYRLRGLASPSLVSQFRQVISGEIVLAGVVILSASLLSYLPPARAPRTSNGLSASQRVDDLLLDLTITPGKVGNNQFLLAVKTSGQPLKNAREVILRFTARKTGLTPSDLDLIGLGDGSYSAKGSNLSLAEEWQVQAIVRREGKFDVYANFDFAMGAKAAAGSAPTRARIPGGMAILAGLAMAGIAFAWQKQTVPLGLGASAGALCLLGVGLLLVFQPQAQTSLNANPIPPNQASIEAGYRLYQANCYACHGAQGKGDGPVGQTLIPRPADLSFHAIPGVHSDAQLFAWISSGFAGTRMPAFQANLSETERWNLVNYVRTLAPKE